MEENITTACGTIKNGFTIKFSRIVRVEVFANFFPKTGIVPVINWNDEEAEYIYFDEE
ncbi:hypothetical protein ACOKXV_06780 [Sporosarcina psychrophila]|uniref:hypothetical protein n=1 Tax=Sporosarcina psychrophila TaxID=1476 RepID=UPI003BA329FA